MASKAPSKASDTVFSAASTAAAASSPASMAPNATTTVSSAASTTAPASRTATKLSALDKVYRMLIRNNFFERGFGDFGQLDAILELKRQRHADVPENYPVHIERVQRVRSRAFAIVHGSLESPLEARCPGLLPPECRRARFQFVVNDADADILDPARPAAAAAAPAPAPARARPVCIQFAATGDHSFWRRRVLSARPLLRQHGIASLLLENPLYGERKPADQLRSNLRHVFDLYVMGLAIQYEAVALLRWLDRLGWGPFGFAGVSMGGHMAFQAAAAWPQRLALVSFLGPFSAAAVFTQGVLSESCNWKVLREEHARRFPGQAPPVQEYVYQLMEDVTSLKSYVGRIDPSAAIVYAARHDAYVPLADVEAYQRCWPGLELRYLDAGHISSFLFYTGDYVRGIADSFARLRTPAAIPATTAEPPSARIAA